MELKVDFFITLQHVVTRQCMYVCVCTYIRIQCVCHSLSLQMNNKLFAYTVMSPLSSFKHLADFPFSLMPFSHIVVVAS